MSGANAIQKVLDEMRKGLRRGPCITICSGDVEVYIGKLLRNGLSGFSKGYYMVKTAVLAEGELLGIGHFGKDVKRVRCGRMWKGE